jgi:hypothetical protein
MLIMNSVTLLHALKAMMCDIIYAGERAVFGRWPRFADVSSSLPS